MTACQRCDAPSQLFLCEPCTSDLRAAALALAEGPYITAIAGKTRSGGAWHIERRTPGLLANLNDVIVRQTRLGRNSGHRKRGDEMPAPYEPDTANGRPTTQGRAQALQHQAANTLSTIIRDVSETRAITIPRMDLAGMAAWIAAHTHTLASSEAASQYSREIHTLVHKIETLIDRPPSQQFCGQCDTMIERKMCGTMLWARRGPTHVTCTNPDCRTSHNIEALYNRWLNHIDYQIVGREKIIGNQRAENPELYDTGIMGALDEFVSWQQFNRWVRERHLKPVRYLRPNGRRGFTRHSDNDIPEYRVGDVRKVRRKMQQRGKTMATTAAS